MYDICNLRSWFGDSKAIHIKWVTQNQNLSLQRTEKTKKSVWENFAKLFLLWRRARDLIQSFSCFSFSCALRLYLLRSQFLTGKISPSHVLSMINLFLLFHLIFLASRYLIENNVFASFEVNLFVRFIYLLQFGWWLHHSWSSEDPE